jgi:hypothetical protein
MIHSNTIRKIFPQKAKGLDFPLKAIVRKIGWLKQLKVAISTKASVPSE